MTNDSSCRFTCVRDTMVLVTDVPMLEPIIIGMAPWTPKTGNAKIQN